MTHSIANPSIGIKREKEFDTSYAVVRPQILSTVLNFVGLKSYTVQIRDVYLDRKPYLNPIYN